MARKKDDRTQERTPEEDEALFVRSLIERGEAAKPDAEGNLPPGATHEIVDDTCDPPKVKRRRFSAF